MEFYSRIVKSGDQLSYYTSGIGTFVKPSSSMRSVRMQIKNKWAAAVALYVTECAQSSHVMLNADPFFLLVTSNRTSWRDINFSPTNTKWGIKYSY